VSQDTTTIGSGEQQAASDSTTCAANHWIWSQLAFVTLAPLASRAGLGRLRGCNKANPCRQASSKASLSLPPSFHASDDSGVSHCPARIFTTSRGSFNLSSPRSDSSLWPLRLAVPTRWPGCKLHGSIRPRAQSADRWKHRALSDREQTVLAR
jgi:hypothetical protein